MSKTEFEKARDEIVNSTYLDDEIGQKNIDKAMQAIAQKGVRVGADWAYEWCGDRYTDLELYDRLEQKLAESETKLSLAVEALESTLPTSNVMPISSKKLVEQALGKIKGETNETKN